MSKVEMMSPVYPAFLESLRGSFGRSFGEPPGVLASARMNPLQVFSIAEDMAKFGWLGPPVLWYSVGGHGQIVQGKARILAAQVAGIDIDALEIRDGQLISELESPNEATDESAGFDKESMDSCVDKFKSAETIRAPGFNRRNLEVYMAHLTDEAMWKEKGRFGWGLGGGRDSDPVGGASAVDVSKWLTEQFEALPGGAEMRERWRRLTGGCGAFVACDGDPGVLFDLKSGELLSSFRAAVIPHISEDMGLIRGEIKQLELDVDNDAHVKGTFQEDLLFGRSAMMGRALENGRAHRRGIDFSLESLSKDDLVRAVNTYQFRGHEEGDVTRPVTAADLDKVLVNPFAPARGGAKLSVAANSAMGMG